LIAPDIFARCIRQVYLPNLSIKFYLPDLFSVTLVATILADIPANIPANLPANIPANIPANLPAD